MKIKKKGNYHKLIIGEEDNTLVIASSGHGKGLLGERIMQEYQKKGWTCITLPSPKLNMEFGYTQFEPQKRYHLKGLKFQKEKPKPIPAKLYHFHTKNFPRTKLPKTNIVTMDIKKIDRLLMYYLFEETGETTTLRVLLNAINSLKNNEGLNDLIDKVKQTKTDKRQLSKTLISFDRFKHDPLIFPHNCEYNLDMKKILKDQKSYHVFSSRYVNDIKTRDFINLYILQEIVKAKQKNPNLPPVCIFMDEIKSLCPEHPVYDFKIPLNKIVSEILSTCRSLGINLISTTQIYGEVASEVRGAFNTLLLGKMSDLKDLNEIAQIIKIDRYERGFILSMKNNEFYLLNIDFGIDRGEFLTFLPQHMHAERGYNFNKIYEKKYPDKMVKHTQQLNKIRDMWKKSQK